MAPPPPPGYAPPPGYSPYPAAPTQKPPRPAVAAGSLLLIAGGAITIAGCFLKWFSGGGESANGFTEGLDDLTVIGIDLVPGGAFVVLSVLAIGFGIAQLAAKKVLAVAILAVVFASFGVLSAMSNLGDLSDLADIFGIEKGPGMYVVALGNLLALAGGIATLAKRRR